MNLEHLKPSAASTICICIVMVFSNGLAIFLLNRPLFIALDIWRLLGICIGFAGPILFCGALLFSFYPDDYPGSPDAENVEARTWAGGAGLAATIFNSILFCCYLGHTSLRTFYIMLVVVNILSIIICAATTMYRREKTKIGKPSN